MRAALSMEQGSSPPQVIVFCAIAAFVQLLSIGNNKEIKKVKQKVKCVVRYIEKKKSETVVIQWKLIILTALYQ